MTDLKSLNKDYWALRGWGVRATTVLMILGMAYGGEEVVISLPK